MTQRLVARLDIKGDNVVRGMHLEGLRVVGQPEEMVARYAGQGIDEIVFIDTVATLYGRSKMLPLIERTAASAFIPLTAGGGIRTIEDVAEMLRAGADKVTINSAAVRRPEFLSEVAARFGSQCAVACIEAKRAAPGQWTVLIENGREPTGLDAVSWARRLVALGAGEILLTSIDADGTRRGYDLDLTRAVADAVSVPVIASGGAGKPEHLRAAFSEAKVDAVALGTILHFGLSDVPTLKRALSGWGIAVRPAPGTPLALEASS
jgi:cyclase